MTRIFEGHLNVQYGQAYVFTGNNRGEFDECFRGQSNGLCGASVPGMLLLFTGLHTGHVGLAIDVLEAPPALDNTWDEIVEVSFIVVDEPVVLQDWDAEAVTSIPLSSGTYRVRYCARNMDKAHEVDTILEDQAPIDFYSLAFWRQATSQDCIIKLTSEHAAYWHNWAKDQGK
jgi:hypothetical protein